MKTRFKVLLLFVSLSFTLCLMSNTYSRYVAGATGELEVLFAKWQILVNETDITNNSSSTIALIPVIEENEFVAENKIAPSSKGYFDIDINPSNVELSFNYSISIGVENENIPDLMITKYAIIDKDYIEGDTLQLNTIENNLIEGTLNFDKNIENFSFDQFIIRIYFEWYEGGNELMNDEADTQIGSSITNEYLKLNANIRFEQKLN